MYKLDNGVSFCFQRRPGWSPANPKMVGKWCFDVDSSEQDAIWDKLLREVRAEHFSGIPAIMMGNQRLIDLNGGRNKMIVFCDDYGEIGVHLTHSAIRRLGINHVLRFKTDAETLRGIHDGMGYDNYIWIAEGDQIRPNIPTEGISG